MNIVSLKGPATEGGITAALERLHKAGGRNQSWWYLAQDQIRCQTKSAVRHLPSENIPAQVCDAHYRFCYEFIWPLMHDMADQATYVEEDFFLYKRLNAILVAQIERHESHDPYFVQDFQLAFIPKFLKRSGRQSAIFWHSPWPKFVPDHFLAPIIEIAEALLAAKAIAFTTKEYADNFNSFVDKHLPYIDSSRSFGRIADVLVAPPGVDLEHWQAQSKKISGNQILGELANSRYVLSIDKADCTMGVMPRLKAIDLFFSANPELKEQITFVQICGRSNPGIKANDSYWTECQSEIAKLTEKYATSDWKPLISLPHSISIDQLTQLYRHAAVMLVTSVRDGLNLTAKEFIACQSTDTPGILALSTAAGATEEFGRHAISFAPDNAEAIAEATIRCLHMTASQKNRRNQRLQLQLQKNPPQLWCDTFMQILYCYKSEYKAS
ncbi:trehalose-6-phosphate synthase [bacterium]|nr:trehalose-6-phosphate synthase [bacterium]